MVRVDKRPMRDRFPSQFRRPLFIDPTKHKKRKKPEVALEGSDVDPTPPAIEIVPPEGYIEFISSNNENIR